MKMIRRFLGGGLAIFVQTVTALDGSIMAVDRLSEDWGEHDARLAHAEILSLSNTLTTLLIEAHAARKNDEIDAMKKGEILGVSAEKLSQGPLIQEDTEHDCWYAFGAK